MERTSPVLEIEDRGRWSRGEGDTRVDLTGAWKAVRADEVSLGSINLPFCWDGWDGELTLTRRFELPDDAVNSSWRLVVDGFAEFIAITLNGAHLDTRRGNEVSFQLDIDSRHLRFGSETNELVFVLDNRLSRHGTVPLKGGIFARRRYGGIFRDVCLVSSPLKAVTELEARWVGDATSAGGHVTVEAEMRRSGPASSSEDGGEVLSVQLLDMVGNRLAATKARSVVFPPGGILKLTVDLPSVSLERWELGGGRGLYRVRADLAGRGVRHALVTTVGVRTLKVRPEGFKLNGEVRWLRCLSYVPAHMETGVIVDEKQLETDFALMRELGVDAIRIMQGAAPRCLLELCDRNGLLVFEELPVFQAPDPVLSEPEFTRTAAEQLEAMIRRDRRYTCIAGWGIGSEINPPNRTNRDYYRKLTELARDMDYRPVYASIPITGKFTADPLDFVILEVTQYSPWVDSHLSELVAGDRPALIGGIRRAVLPGKLGGYADPTSEAGQADYLVDRLKEIERLDWCAGVIIGELTDWPGAVPSVSAPLRGTTSLYTTGLLDGDRRPRLAFHRLKEYWASGRVDPLPRGESPPGEGGLLVIVGLGLIIVLLVATRQNNLFRLNLYRTFTSPRGFFQDISDRRYFQSGHTLLLAMLIAGGLAMIGAAWLHSGRQSYPLDWSLGQLCGSGEPIRWAASLVWHPARGLMFFWAVIFLFIWLGSLRVMIFSRLMGRRCSLAQGLDFLVWSSAGFLILLPIGMVSERLFDGSGGWLVIVVLILLIVWSNYRLVSVLQQYVRRPVGTVFFLCSIGFVIACVVLVAVFEYTHNFSLYWSYFWGTIIQ